MVPFCLYISVTLIFLLSAQLAQAETVSVPLQVEFPLLQQLFIKQLYREPSASIEILNDPFLA
jgi:hypothetical protein